MKQTKKVLATLLFTMALVFGINITANAAEVTQTNQTDTTITINFNYNSSGVSSTTLTGWTVTLQKYESGNKVDVQPAVPLAANVNTYTFSNLTPGTRFYVRVDYNYNYSSGKGSSSYISKDVYTAPGKVTGLNQKKWWYFIEKVDFEWDEQNNCQYEWKAYQGKKEVASKSSVYSNSGSFNVKNNKLYTVKARAYETINGQTVYGDWSEPAYLFTQPMVSSKGVTIDGSGKMKVKWGKINGVDGYSVYVSTKEKSGYKKVASVKASKASATIKKFKKKKFSKNKTYYVYVVAKKKINGVVNTSGRLYSMQYKKGATKLRWSFSGK